MTRDHRAAARAELDGAMLMLIRAFNAANLPSVPYRFSAETIGRVQCVIADTLEIFRNATVEPNHAVIDGDAAFQRFIAKTIGDADIAAAMPHDAGKNQPADPRIRP